MRIIIAGAGEVGFHLAKLLSFESHDIILLDQKTERLHYADLRLDIKVIKGNATSIRILKQAEVKSTDLVIAVTSNETVNITICVLAKRLGAKKTIARVSNSEFIDNKNEINFSEFGIDELISTEELATKEIKMLLNQAAFNHMHEFDNGQLSLSGVILSKTAPFIGMTVKEAAATFPEVHFMPIAIQTNNSNYSIIPRGDTIFKSGDLVYFITVKEGVNELYKLTGKIKEPVKNIMILGGSSVGRRTAKLLCKKHLNVKLIEKNKARALELADRLPNTLVIHGDGRDIELLREESIKEMDVFIGATSSSETNIMACLIAKSKGVKKTIALAEIVDYSKLSHSIGIHSIINKKLLAANSIFRYIRKGDVLEIATLNNLDVEILEFKVRENSKITMKDIRHLNFPRNAIIGGVIRNGKGIIALGDFRIKANDKVVVICLSDNLKQVEKFFA
ncbi:Trk system potassium transporter TrkA [Aureibaculum marinum]|uniref:Trk system potassium uptake protein TrkA n=1 Tax=Aureibaculum marinum TaxID=2487930 RepID=A0A3N4NWC6_9FLAO|nr:Trk system potassium transporter TrkA [Aureibaculum marinum]RPE00146.1 Trk system potassium transporter TrkA [Aureibaculum marinum]